MSALASRTYDAIAMRTRSLRHSKVGTTARGTTAPEIAHDDNRGLHCFGASRVRGVRVAHYSSGNNGVSMILSSPCAGIAVGGAD